MAQVSSKRRGCKKIIPSVLNNKYAITRTRVKVDSLFEIDRITDSIVRTETGEELINSTRFSLYRGWFQRRFMLGSGGLSYSCGDKERKANSISGSKYNHFLTSWVFLPEEIVIQRVE